MFINILVAKADGTQALVQVDPSGGVSKDLTVLWDERADGPFPANQVVNIGGLVRVGNALTFDSALKAANDAKIAAVLSTQTTANNALKAAVLRLQGVDSVVDLAGAKVILKDLAAVVIRLIQKEIF